MVFDCGQLAYQNSPKGTRLKNVPREAKLAFARWRDRSAAGHPMFDLYAVAVGNANKTKASWHFTTPNARIKLKHLYPSI
jgi:hypothetical protein